MATALMRVRDPVDVGHIIHRRRRVMGWSQERLAKAAGVGRQWVLELEKGKKGAPLDLVINVLDALGYTLDVSNDMAVAATTGSEIASFRPKAYPGAKGAGTGQRSDREVSSHLPVTLNSDDPPGERLDSTVERLPGYRIATFETIGIAAGHLYRLENRPLLERMVTHVIAVEGPVFVDLIARRIARAHRLTRATRKLIETIEEITDGRFARTREGDRTIIWPERAEISNLLPFRPALLGTRDHADIPLVELASLATPLLTDGHEPEAAALIMGRLLGLELIRPTTRSRLTMAAELANQQQQGAANGYSD